MQYLRTFFQFCLLSAEKGKFLIGVPTRMQAGPWAHGRWRHPLCKLASELVS